MHQEAIDRKTQLTEALYAWMERAGHNRLMEFMALVTCSFRPSREEIADIRARVSQDYATEKPGQSTVEDHATPTSEKGLLAQTFTEEADIISARVREIVAQKTEQARIGFCNDFCKNHLKIDLFANREEIIDAYHDARVKWAAEHGITKELVRDVKRVIGRVLSGPEPHAGT